MTVTGDAWGTVAAPGTDPGLLAAVVRRLGDVGPAAVAGAARDRAAAAPGDAPAALLRHVVPPRLPTDGHAGDDADVVRTWHALGVRVALVGDPGFPPRLTVGWPGSGGPPLLAVRGALPGAERPAVAIVGARRATSYGTGVAAWLAEAAGAAGATVVSGGAVGIDAAAHGAATDHGTVVVLGCGHDVAYPRPHTVAGGLFERVLAGGGALVSEHLPGAAPVAAHVRARNRIVAGLADVVVVVEGGARSGALVTAGYAADAGVPVLAVPGDVRRPGSAAPHLLLREGAEPCTSPDDLLAALSLAAPAVADGTAPAVATTLPPEVHRALAGAWPRPLRLDVLAEEAEVPAARLLALVTRARVAGEVAEGADGIRLTRAPR